jgi:tetratricopeptide (TPR) repeat protein
MRHRGVAAAALVLACTVQVAVAGPLEDCTISRDAQKRLKSCSEVIAATAFAKEDKARAYRTRAGLRLEAGAAADAVADYTQALRLAPPDVVALSGRARARMLLSDTKGALEDFSEALKLQPASAGLLIARGHVYFVRGEAAAAIADFTEALRLNPSSASALNQRGLAYRRSGETEKAITDYTAAIAINPVYALAYNNRGYAYESIGRKDDAIADFRSALLLDASLVGARDGLARLGAPAATTAETAKRIADGADLVGRHCATCHAVGAQGDSPNPKSPPFRTLAARHSGLSLREPLTRGIAAPHDEMPKFALATDQVDSIIAYINNLAPKPAARQGKAPQSKWQVTTEAVELGDVEKGRLYARRICADCHNITASDAASPNRKAPRFKAIASTPGMTVTALTVWSRTPHVSMPNLVIPQDELENLSAYILSLKRAAP